MEDSNFFLSPKLKRETAPCDINAVCTDTEGAFKCDCISGYEGSGDVCDDVDECCDDCSSCQQFSDCENTVGSFICNCFTGYSEGTSESGNTCTFINCPNGFGRNSTTGRCENIDECQIESSCDANSQCTDSIGDFSCSCNEGYTGDGKVLCEDVNECETFNCGPNTECLNNPGSFECLCLDGFKPLTKSSGWTQVIEIIVYFSIAIIYFIF